MPRIQQQSTIDPRKPRCRLCDTVTSVYWRVPARNFLLCNNCFLKDLNGSKSASRFCKLERIDTNITTNNDITSSAVYLLKHRCLLSGFFLPTQTNGDEQSASSSSSSSSSMVTNPKLKRRKSIETKPPLPIKIPTRQQPNIRMNRKTMAFKGKKPEKCMPQSTTFKLFDVLYSKGRRFQTGDIVYLIDAKLSCFYAQIRALFQDEQLNGFAFLTWLLPTMLNSSSTDNFHFDPNAYSIGPNEEYPRSLNSLSFVCHAPSDYFQVKTYPQSITIDNPNKRSFNYVWTSLCDSTATLVSSGQTKMNDENDCSPTTTTKRRRYV